AVVVHDLPAEPLPVELLGPFHVLDAEEDRAHIRLHIALPFVPEPWTPQSKRSSAGSHRLDLTCHTYDGCPTWDVTDGRQGPAHQPLEAPSEDSKSWMRRARVSG